MINSILLFLVAAICGGAAFFLEKKIRPHINTVLSFSGAYLISICFLHLLPELFKDHELNYGLYILIGFFLQLILDYFSGGIEHGHTHIKSNKVGKFPWFVFLSLCLHAFLESIPVNHIHHESGISSYLIGLIIHKGPIAFILTSLLIGYKLSRSVILGGILFFSLTAPMGLIFGNSIIIDSDLFSKLLAISIGIILHLSTTILLETNEEHKIHWKKVIPMLLGATVGLSSLIIH